MQSSVAPTKVVCIGLLLSLAGTTLLPQPAFASETLLQTIDLNDMGMSTEGGVAKLYRLTNSRAGWCKIEVVHYGEMGKLTYRFVFSAHLNYAARRDYAYSDHIASGNEIRETLREELLLQSSEGRRTLPADFATYKAMFSPAVLGQCSGGARR